MPSASKKRALDFSKELARCDELERICDGSPFWSLHCDEWADDVYRKLQSWSPHKAERFLLSSIFESSGGINMIDEPSGSNQKLTELRQRRERLRLIVDQSKVQWLLSLLRP
jgi:hypothetical protein